MRKFIRNLVASVGLALSVLAIGVLSAPEVALAQLSTAPRGPVPRYFQTQQTGYLRFAINFNSCVYVTLTCTFKVGSVPYNAFMMRAYTQNITTFSGGGVTAMTASFGTTSSAATNLMAAVTILTAGNAVTQSLAAGGLGTTVTGNGIAQSGLNGGFDIYVTITATTGAPTAGAAMGLIEYAFPNDGSCAPVPLGSTAAGC